MSERITVASLDRDLQAHKQSIEERIRRVEDKFDKHQTSTIERLAKIEAYQKTQSDTLNNININVEKMKDVPSTRWNQIISVIISTLVGGVIAYILMQVGLK